VPGLREAVNASPNCRRQRQCRGLAENGWRKRRRSEGPDGARVAESGRITRARAAGVMSI